MAFQQGSPIQPQLGAVDFSEMRRGASQASRSIMEGTGRAAQLRAEAGAAMGQAFSDVGATMAQSIDKFIQKKEEKKQEEAAINLLQSFATSELEKVQQQMGAATVMPQFQQPQPGQLDEATMQQVKPGAGTVLKPDTSEPSTPAIGSIESISRMADTASARQSAAAAQQQLAQRTNTLRKMAQDPSIAKEAVKSVGPAAAIDFVMGRVASDRAAAQQAVENRLRERSFALEERMFETDTRFREEELRQRDEAQEYANRLKEARIDQIEQDMNVTRKEAERMEAISTSLASSFVDGQFDVQKFTKNLSEAGVGIEPTDFGYVVQSLAQLSEQNGLAIPGYQTILDEKDAAEAAFLAGEMDLKEVGTRLINVYASEGFISKNVADKLLAGGETADLLSSAEDATHGVIPQDSPDQDFAFIGSRATLERLFGDMEGVDIRPRDPAEYEESLPDTPPPQGRPPGAQPIEDDTVPAEGQNRIGPINIGDPRNISEGVSRAAEGAGQAVGGVVDAAAEAARNIGVAENILGLQILPQQEEAMSQEEQLKSRLDNNQPIAVIDKDGIFGPAGERVIIGPNHPNYSELKGVSPADAIRQLQNNNFQLQF